MRALLLLLLCLRVKGSRVCGAQPLAQLGLFDTPRHAHLVNLSIYHHRRKGRVHEVLGRWRACSRDRHTRERTWCPSISMWRAITAHTLSLAMPVQLELEDQDQIDAMVRQEGGRQ